MSKCATCGNNYDKSFLVKMGDQSFDFDSFECAIQKLAPQCERCQCRIIGHGVEAKEKMFCCVHCAKKTLGEAIDLQDRQDHLNVG